jgi:periplasmic copper chaperone A
MMRKITAVAATCLVAALSLGAAACGSDDSGSDKVSIDVTDVWTRVTAPKQTNGAVYMTISSADGDTLTKASVPASIAARAELHETTGAMSSGGSGSDSMDSADSSSMEMDSMKGMKQVQSIAIPAGKTVQLKPGGYHVMLLELAKPVTDGEKVPVTLTFEKAGELTFDAVARES